MADFCNVCSDYLFGENLHPDIDVNQITEELNPGYMMPVLCEGCAMVAVEKSETGEVTLITGGNNSFTYDQWKAGVMRDRFL
jgi:hypothetical protein